MWPPVNEVTCKAEERIEETAAAAGTAAITEMTDGHVRTAQECPGSLRWERPGYSDFYMGRWEDTENDEHWDDEYSLLHEECNPHK